MSEKMSVYLDNSATTRQYDQVTDAMAEAMRDFYGNPSSLHRLGIDAEKKVRTARKSLAGAFGCSEDEVIFTSCGTEADNTVLMGAAASRKRAGKKIITTAVEHPAILEPAKKLESMGYQVEYIGVDKNCRLNMDHLKAAISEDTILISVMGVNNEAGTVMPVSEIARIKDEYNKAHGTQIWLHSDAVQAFGKIPVNVKKQWQGVDLISVSGHKIHGPKGMGALFVRKGLNIEPFMIGGGQEKHMRSGTENTPGIIGFGMAADLGNAEALFNMGVFYMEGMGCDQDMELSAKYFHRAARRRHPEAQYAYADLLSNGWGVEQDLQRAIKWFADAAENGNVEAMYRLGEIYEQGIGTEVQLDAAIKWYDAACNKGHRQAAQRLVMCKVAMQEGN